ncbi:unnamed protein product [Arabis nemorensis]|uniref:Ubiquitin-like protease family profile domain-containing protein n=1 Tax=Arabis nemorensis TaxID=586526 RepID=A0A565AND9_9BRAS|nr:unnamed protein product [Arabis nemorensis]
MGDDPHKSKELDGWKRLTIWLILAIILVDSILHSDDPAPEGSLLWENDELDTHVMYVESLLKNGFEFDDNHWFGGQKKTQKDNKKVESVDLQQSKRMTGKKCVRDERINNNDDDDFKTSKIVNDVHGEKNYVYGEDGEGVRSDQCQSIIGELRRGLLLQRQHTDNVVEGLKSYIDKKISEALSKIMDLFVESSPVIHDSTRTKKSRVSNKDVHAPSVRTRTSGHAGLKSSTQQMADKNLPTSGQFAPSLPIKRVSKKILPSTSDTHVHKPNVNVSQPMMDVQHLTDNRHPMEATMKEPRSPSPHPDLTDLPMHDDQSIPSNTIDVRDSSALNVRMDMESDDVCVPSPFNGHALEKGKEAETGYVSTDMVGNLRTSAVDKDAQLEEDSKDMEGGGIRVHSLFNGRTSEEGKKAEIGDVSTDMVGSNVRVSSPSNIEEDSKETSPSRIIDDVIQNLNRGVMLGGKAVTDVQGPDSMRDGPARVRVPTLKMQEYVAVVQKPKAVIAGSIQYNPLNGINHDHFSKLNDRTITIFDSHRSTTRENIVKNLMQPLLVMLPYLLSDVFKSNKKLNLSLTPYTYVCHTNIAQNVKVGDCSPMAMKHLELMALNSSFEPLANLDEASIANLRMNFAFDVFEFEIHHIPLATVV